MQSFYQKIKYIIIFILSVLLYFDLVVMLIFSSLKYDLNNKFCFNYSYFNKGTADENLQWDDIISPFFDLPQLETVFEANGGLHPGSPFPCPQKLMTLNRHFWTPTMHFGQGLILNNVCSKFKRF